MYGINETARSLRKAFYIRNKRRIPILNDTCSKLNVQENLVADDNFAVF